MTAVSHIEFFVEEPSAEAALNVLIPRIRPGVGFKVHAFSGKPDLLGKLPLRLKGYKSWLPEDWRIVVLVDKDREDCHALKRQLDDIAAKAGLVPRSQAPKGRFQVLNRIAIEEFEARLLGDARALAETYPGVPASLGAKREFRDVDAIRGGTWEALERVLQRAGHFPGGIAKTQVAREVSVRMDPARNTSRSFQVFCKGLSEL